MDGCDQHVTLSLHSACCVCNIKHVHLFPHLPQYGICCKPICWTASYLDNPSTNLVIPSQKPYTTRTSGTLSTNLWCHFVLLTTVLYHCNQCQPRVNVTWTMCYKGSNIRPYKKITINKKYHYTETMAHKAVFCLHFLFQTISSSTP